MKKYLMITLILAGTLLMLTEGLRASTIQKCSAKTKTCVIKLEEGLAGDSVSVLNERAQLVATGWIVKREGSFGLIKFNKVFRDVKRGYPAIVNIDNRSKNERGVASRI